MAPIVSNETRKAQPERGLLISGMRLVVWMDRYNSHLPIAPIPCRLLMDCRIRTHKKMMIGVDEAAVSAVESKPASWGRIKTSHFFPINRSKMFWQEADLRFFEQWR